ARGACPWLRRRADLHGRTSARSRVGGPRRVPRGGGGDGEEGGRGGGSAGDHVPPAQGGSRQPLCWCDSHALRRSDGAGPRDRHARRRGSPLHVSLVALSPIMRWHGKGIHKWSRLSSSRASICETACMIHHMGAVTFAVRAMPEAITFYTQLGFTLVYGSPQARFSTLQAGDALINLTLAP